MTLIILASLLAKSLTEQTVEGPGKRGNLKEALGNDCDRSR